MIKYDNIPANVTHVDVFVARKILQRSGVSCTTQEAQFEASVMNDMITNHIVNGVKYMSYDGRGTTLKLDRSQRYYIVKSLQSWILKQIQDYLTARKAG